jgi:hypothetical protein
LEARYSLITKRDEEIAPRLARGYGEVVGPGKSRPSQVGCDIAYSNDRPAERRERPYVDRRYLLIRSRKKLAFRVLEIDIVEQERIVTAAIQVEKGDTAEQAAIPTKGENRLGVGVPEPGKTRVRKINSGDYPPGNRGKACDLLRPRRADVDHGRESEPIQFVPGTKIPTSSERRLHLRFHTRVDDHLT